MQMLPEPTPDLRMSQRIGLRLADILWHRHFELAELVGAVVWMLWGLALLNPWGSTFASSNAYRALIYVLPYESVWGLWAFALGLSQLGAMLYEVRWWRIIAGGMLFGWGLFVGV